jgi:hypothetical protein
MGVFINVNIVVAMRCDSEVSKMRGFISDRDLQAVMSSVQLPTDSEAELCSYEINTESPLLRVKRPESKADHSCYSCSKVQLS